MRVGDVIHTHVSSIYPPKAKYLVCICTEPRYFLLINTELRAHYECIEIDPHTYPALKGITRYISCSNIFQPDIEKYQVLWSLEKKDILRVLEQIQKSKRLSSHTKKIILSQHKEHNFKLSLSIVI